MQGMLFNAAQNYAWILEFSRKLLVHESSGEKANKTEHQINTRLFNNAFCGLLRLGYLYTLSNEDTTPYLVLTIEGTEYKCPVTTASNILREEFEQHAPDAASLVIPKSKEKKAKKSGVIEQSPTKEVVIDGASTKSETEPKIPSSAIPAIPQMDTTKKQEITTSDKQESKKTTKPATEAAEHQKQTYPDKSTEEKRREPEITSGDQKKVTKQNAAAVQPLQEQPSTPYISNILMNAGFPNLDDLSFAFSKGSDKIQKVGVEAGSAEVHAPESKKTESEQKGIDTLPKNESKDPETKESADQSKPVVSTNESLNNTGLPSMETDFMLPPGDEGDEGDDGLPALQAVTTPAIQPETNIPHVPVETVQESENANEDHEISAHATSNGHFFKPKNQPVIQPMADEESGDDLTNDAIGAKTKEGKKGLFSFFKKEKGEKGEEITPRANPPSIAVPESSVEISVSEPTPDESVPVVPVTQPVSKQDSDHNEAYDYSQDGGQLFQRIHQVIVKPRFGDVIVSRARFIIWPTRIITMYAGNTFADFLVHVTDATGNEQIFCTDGKVKQLKMTVDGKQYCVYSIWNNGVFESHVVLDEKSASMFRMEEEVQKQEPDGKDGDAFLDQFRYDHKGQPFHFIVPFLSSNRGELNIPIIGFVSIDGKKYPLERCEGNTLRYRTRTKTEKIIRGHWEKGAFVFNIDDANKVLWEEEVETAI